MGLKNTQCVCFLDDIMSGSITFRGMIDNLRAVFNRISQSKMLLQPSKCEFFKPKIKFLGVIIDKNGISPCPEKVDSIVKMSRPTSVKSVRAFLGAAGFFRRWIEKFSLIAQPLSRLTKKHTRFQWDDQTEKAWQTIKDKLATAPVLAHPNLDKPFWLVTDASAFAIGAILAQKDENGKLHPVSYGSTILNATQRRWSTVQRELYALVHFCDKYSNFLLGKEFTVLSDNKTLLHLDNFKATKNNRLWRWLELLQNYKFKVEYIPTDKNPSDVLSRLPRHNDPLLHTLPEMADVLTATAPSHQNPSSDTATSKITPFISFRNDTLKVAQESDRTLSTVKVWLEAGEKPKSSDTLNRELYTYYNSFDRLSLINDVIHRSWGQKSSERNLQLVCIPESLQKM